MTRLSFAIVGAAGLLLTACSGNNEDAVNADVNAAQIDEINMLAGDAANDAANEMESDTLANQAAQLEEQSDSNASANADVPATTADDEAMNVAGM